MTASLTRSAGQMSVRLGLVLSLFVCCIAAHAQAGSMDLSFDPGGIRFEGFGGGHDIANAIAQQPDGKLVLAGYATGVRGAGTNFALVRLNADGPLDTGFGANGKVTTAVTPWANAAMAVAIQPDGKIVAAGYAQVNANANNNEFAVVRYNEDGSLDTTFHADGKLTARFGALTNNDQARAVVIQPDGKIVAAGRGTLTGTSNTFFGVMRFNPDGSLDAAFDGDGRLKTAIGSPSNADANAAALQPDGKIVVAGYAVPGASGLDLTLVRYNADGSLDTSFDGDGIVSTAVSSSSDLAYAVAIQPDGKIVAAGSATFPATSGDFAVVRYEANGALDTTFDGDGIVTAAIGPGANSDNALSVAIQPDGKIIAAGQSNGLTGSEADFSAARFNPDGSLDITFSGDGKANIDVTMSGTVDLATGVAILPDGRIAMAGYAVMTETAYDQAAVMLAADGSLDVSFGGGRVTIDIGNDSADGNGAVVQPDGKIVVVGYADSGSRGPNFALQRFNVDGSLDNSFGTGGKVTTPIGLGTAADQAFAAALQPDGKIVVAGSAVMGTTGTDFALARYNPNGTLDTTFDGDGIVTTAIGPTNSTDAAAAVVIQPDGKIVAAGYAAMGSSGDDFAVVRYNANGSLDTAFSGDGIAITTIAAGTGVDRARAIALQADGKMVAAGFSNMGSPTGQDFSLVRYNADGSLDLSFDGDGKVTTSIGAATATDNANAVAIQPDGKIVAAGTANITGSGNDFAAVRYTAAGGLDTTFDGDGIVTTAVGPTASSDLGNAVAVQADGKILVGGTALTTVPGDQDPALVRYNTDGSLDTTFGTGGKFQLALPGTAQQVRALVLYPYDRVVIAGGGGTNFFAGRVWLDTVATAGRVTVAGRVTDASGRGVQGVSLRLTGGDGETRTAVTGSFGYYAFRDVEAGGTYTLSASARGRTIQDAVRLVRVNDELLGQDFRAERRAPAEPKRE